MQDFIIEIMNRFGYFGVTFLIAIENIFPPIPSEVILSFGGFMTTYTNLSIPLVILCSTIGSVIGAILLYGIGYFLDIERLEKIVNSRIGKILHLKMKDIKKAEQWFEKKEKIAIFLCRFVPIVRSLISIPAGMTKMKFWLFLLLTTLGTLIWNTVLVICGAIMGENWNKIVYVIEKYSSFVLIASISLVLGIIIYSLYKKKK